MSQRYRTKATSNSNQQVLKDLAKRPGNKTCADCKTGTNPRWASWNIGVFICIRCSGVHRSMGTHISKVKSIDLDTWTDEQVQSMVSWGNLKANSYWEHNLPKNHVPDDGKIQNFIRTKYELKKWASTKYVPDPATVKGDFDGSTAANLILPTANAEPQPVNDRATVTLPAPPPQKPRSDNLLSDLTDKPNVSSTKPAGGSLLDLNFSGTSQSKPSPQPSINSGRASNRPDLKKSILALYSTPASNSTPALNSGGALGGINSSLAGLSLGGSVGNLNSTSATTTSNTSTTTAKKPLFDDDVFKNVWG